MYMVGVSEQVGGAVGIGDEWKAEGGLYHPSEQEQGHCVFNEAQKQPQRTCQAKSIVGSSLTPHATTLLVLPTPCSGPSLIYRVRECCL